ncbi:MAG: class I SAM-dependent methyltransferase [Deltaproteobacteria bacterium]|nr:class I SAM-dependent methyltransferase [Deltaproteobacteria bacterium]
MKPPPLTRSEAYAERLETLGGAGWKRWLDVQRPYRRHLRRLALGFTLEVGCGLGRNLLHLERHGVGVEHNPRAVEIARRRGCTVMLPEEFRTSDYARPGRFDSLLLAHVVEHMSLAEAVALVGEHLGFVRNGGTVVLIAPQEAGFRSDPTHVEFMDAPKLLHILESNGVTAQRAYSFPLPRVAGRVFTHNEFVVIGRKP